MTEHSQSNFPTRWSDVFFGGGKFVAINDALVGEIALFVSEDGITWQDKTSTLPLNSYSSTFRPRRGVYGNNMYVIIGGVDIAYSQNLNSWQLGGKEWDTEKMGITFGSGKFAIVTRTKTGSNYPGNTGNIMTSTNGNDWTVHTTPNDGNMQFHTGVISYGGGKFVAIGSDAGAHGKIGPNVIYSSDGINWYLENIYNYQIRDIAFGNNRFVTTSGHLRSY